jgi:ketosteroid isomerase-like protein
MTARLLGALALLCLVAIAPAQAAPADDAAALEAKWGAPFAKWDLDALAALYTKDALFFGSAPGLFIVQDGVKTYFSKLPKSVFKSAAFSDQHVIRLSSGIIVAAGFVTFAHEMNGQTSQLPFRITFPSVQQVMECTIAAYHASPKGI